MSQAEVEADSASSQLSALPPQESLALPSQDKNHDSDDNKGDDNNSDNEDNDDDGDDHTDAPGQEGQGKRKKVKKPILWCRHCGVHRCKPNHVYCHQSCHRLVQAALREFALSQDSLGALNHMSADEMIAFRDAVIAFRLRTYSRPNVIKH